MKEVFKRYFPSLVATIAANSVTVLIVNYNPTSIWAIISSVLIWIGGAVLVFSFIFEMFKSRKKWKYAIVILEVYDES